MNTKIEIIGAEKLVFPDGKTVHIYLDDTLNIWYNLDDVTRITYSREWLDLSEFHIDETAIIQFEGQKTRVVSQTGLMLCIPKGIAYYPVRKEINKLIQAWK